MKQLLLIVALSFVAKSFAQETAGIYNFKWFVDKRLTNSTIVSSSNSNSNWGVDRIAVPQNLYDSVLNRVKWIVQNELKMDAVYFYPLKNNGKELRTSNTAESVGGLPRGTKRRAMRTEYMNQYVKFRIHVGLNKTFGIGAANVNYSRLKPYVRVKIKSKGFGRGNVYRKTTRLGDFPSINSVEFNMGGVTVTNTNALPIEQVLDMVFKGLDKFQNKVKI